MDSEMLLWIEEDDIFDWENLSSSSSAKAASDHNIENNDSVNYNNASLNSNSKDSSFSVPFQQQNHLHSGPGNNNNGNGIRRRDDDHTHTHSMLFPSVPGDPSKIKEEGNGITPSLTPPLPMNIIAAPTSNEIYVFGKTLPVAEFLASKKIYEDKLEMMKKILSYEDKLVSSSITLQFNDVGLESLFLFERWKSQSTNLMITMIFILPVDIYILHLQMSLASATNKSTLLTFGFLTALTFFSIFLIIFTEKISQFIMSTMQYYKDNGVLKPVINPIYSYRGNVQTLSYVLVGVVVAMYPILTSFHFLATELFLCPKTQNYEVSEMDRTLECRWLQHGLSPPFWHYAPCLTLASSVLSGSRWSRSAPFRVILLVVMALVFLRRLRYSVLVPTVSIHAVLAVLLLFVMFKLERATRQNFLQAKLQIVALHLQRFKAILELAEAEEAAKVSKMSATEKVATTLRVSFPDYETISSKTRSLINKAIKALPKDAYDEIKKGEYAFDEFELERRLSSGGFCTVYRGTIKGRPCAVKSISANDALSYDAIEGLIQEVLLLSKLNHPNIVQTIGYCWSPHICLILEFMEKGTLNDLLSYRSLALSWADPLLVLASQIASALAYLHAFNPPILHRDIKTRNVLMADFRHCKLADFGLSIALEDEKVKRAAGTRRYCAPELLKGSPSSTQADVWSFGVCLWEMATRVHFPDREPKVTTLPDHLPYPIPKTIRDVIKASLNMSPDSRPGFKEIKVVLDQLLKEQYRNPNGGVDYKSPNVHANSGGNSGSLTKIGSADGNSFSGGFSESHSQSGNQRNSSKDVADSGENSSLSSSRKAQSKGSGNGKAASGDNIIKSTANDDSVSDLSNTNNDQASQFDEPAARFAAEIPRYIRHVQDMEVSALTSVESLQGLRLWGNMNQFKDDASKPQPSETSQLVSDSAMSTTSTSATSTSMTASSATNTLSTSTPPVEESISPPINVPKETPSNTTPPTPPNQLPNVPTTTSLVPADKTPTTLIPVAPITPPQIGTVIDSKTIKEDNPTMSNPMTPLVQGLQNPSFQNFSSPMFVSPTHPNQFAMGMPQYPAFYNLYPNIPYGMNTPNYAPYMNSYGWQQPPIQHNPYQFQQWTSPLNADSIDLQSIPYATSPNPGFNFAAAQHTNVNVIEALMRLGQADIQAVSEFEQYKQAHKAPNTLNPPVTPIAPTNGYASMIPSMATAMTPQNTTGFTPSNFSGLTPPNSIPNSSPNQTYNQLPKPEIMGSSRPQQTNTNVTITTTPNANDFAFAAQARYTPSMTDINRTLQRLQIAEDEFQAEDTLSKAKKASDVMRVMNSFDGSTLR